MPRTLTKLPKLAVALFASWPSLWGCGEQPLARRSRVSGPRVLAIVAEPPEVRPGERVSIRAVTGGLTMEPTFRWWVCARPEATTTFSAASTFGVAEPDQGCFGDAAVGTVELPSRGPSVTLSVPADLLTRIDALSAVYGRRLPVETLRTLARTVGLPFTIALEMSHGTTTVRAIKRVVVKDTMDPNVNPPRPRFRFGIAPDGGHGGVAIVPLEGDDDPCGREDRAPLQVHPGQRVEIAPDPNESAWLQEYDTLDSSGHISRLRETAFYSWFATDGWFSADRTRIPTRNTFWTAPNRPGSVTHWLVVRDGRGGTSVCRYVVDVQPAQ